MKECRNCEEELRGHEDDSIDVCRWCVAGWKPESVEENDTEYVESNSKESK